MSKKVLVALSPAFLEQVDFIAQVEHRTRSDLIRESLRRYLDAFKTEMVAPVIVEKPQQEAPAVLQHECKCHFCKQLEAFSR